MGRSGKECQASHSFPPGSLGLDGEDFRDKGRVEADVPGFLCNVHCASLHGWLQVGEPETGCPPTGL